MTYRPDYRSINSMEQGYPAPILVTIPIGDGVELFDRANDRTCGHYSSDLAARQAMAKVERGNPRPDLYASRRDWLRAQAIWRKPDPPQISPGAEVMAKRRAAIRARARSAKK